MITIHDVVIQDFAILVGESPLIVTTGGSRNTFTHRRGSRVLVVARSESGEAFTGVGELVEPVFFDSVKDVSSEKILEEARVILLNLSTALRGRSFDADDWENGVRNIIDIFFACENLAIHARNIACYAMEQALLIMVARYSRMSLVSCIQKYLFGDRRSSANVEVLRLNSMVNARHGEAVGPIHGCVKIKVGSSNPKADADLVNSIVPSRDAHIRLDANQMWTHAQAEEFVEQLSESSVKIIEYIEEPMLAENISQLTDSIRSIHKIRIGLDESLLLSSIQEFASRDKSIAVIFKASLHCLREWRNFFAENSDRVTVTCTFESGLGLGFLCALAAAINPRTHHGISALPAMIRNDDSTAKFHSIIREDGDGLFIRLDEVEALVYSL